MDLFILHQIRHTKCDIKDFTKMVNEFKTKNIARNTNIYIYIYIYLSITLRGVRDYGSQGPKIQGPGVLVPLYTMPYLLELFKRRSKVQERNMSCERVLNFEPWKTFPKNVSQWEFLWLVYNFIENYCRLRIFTEFIQTQKRYPTSLNKIRILTWKLIFISS